MESTKNEDLTTIDVHGHRSPVFSTNEVHVLLNIIEKYKTIVLNKAVNSVSNFAKDAAWTKIAKLHNAHNFKHMRTPEVLRTKWLNLKRNARKVSLNEVDSDFTQHDKNTIRVIQLIREMENSNEATGSEHNTFQEFNDDEDERNDMEDKYCQDDTSLYDSMNETELERRARTSNFSPQECDLLIKCLKPERKFIFSSKTNRMMCEMKNAAWIRITNKFNEISPNKRSMRTLKTKFENMKRRFKKFCTDANDDQSKQDLQLEIGVEPIKSEFFESKMDDSDIDDDEENVIGNNEKSPLHNNDDSLDPLKFVMNTDSGIELTGDMTPWNDYENKEVVKLKMELLNYQLETAKLKRRRLEEAIKADAEERDSRALEAALRLRKARLEVIKAEKNLPESHPALAFTDKEKFAQKYLKRIQ